MAAALDFITSWILLVIPQPCFDKFFVEFNFLDVDCLKVVISKCLGYGIILGSVLVKLPQIIKIFSAKSGRGINLVSVLVELLAVSASSAYGYASNFPFTAYGEGVFLIIQTTVIALLVMAYGGRGLLAALFLALYSALMGFLMSPAVPKILLWYLQASNMPMIIVSKLIQVVENFRNGSTGQLSAITVFLLFAGAVARIFTSIQETGDQLIIMTYIVSTVCNGLIAFQMVYYWNSKIKTQ